jgi:ATP phosphoribosyltransferase regulatory subunit
VGYIKEKFRMKKEYRKGSEIKWIPDGFHFLGLQEAKKRRNNLNKIHAYFLENNFEEVDPPRFDFSSSFYNHIIDADKSKLFKARDLKGNEISPSIDLTLQVVKGIAGSSNIDKNLKVYYIGKIIKDSDGSTGSRREICQAGAEVIGTSDSSSIKNILFLINGLLKTLTLETKVTLVLGNMAVILSILNKIGVTREEMPIVLNLLYSKNKVELENILINFNTYPELKKIFFKLLLSFNPSEILTELKLLNDKFTLGIGSNLTDTEDIFQYASNNLENINLCLDYSLYRDLDYYTGFIFQAYTDGSSEPILSGGAYDKLFEKFTGVERKACGFALNVDVYEDIIGN